MFRFLASSCWIFRGHSLNICVAAFLLDLNFLFSLALLNRAGTVKTFKTYGGFIKGTDSEQKLKYFFRNFQHFSTGRRVAQCEWPCIYVNICALLSVRSVVVFVNYATTYSRIRGTEYECWFMKIHESGFWKGFFIIFPPKAGQDG